MVNTSILYTQHLYIFTPGGLFMITWHVNNGVGVPNWNMTEMECENENWCQVWGDVYVFGL